MPVKSVKSTKRSHPSTCEEHPVKKIRVDPMVGAILEGLDMTQDVSISCKAMLAAMVPQALTVPLDERHPYQNTFVNIVEECMNTTEDNMKTAISKDKEQISALNCSRETLEKNVEDAQKVHDVKTNVMDQHKTKLADNFRAVLEKRVLLSSAQQAHNALSAPIADLRKEAEVCRQAISEDLAAVRADAVAISDHEMLCTRLVALASRFGIEETLVASLPAVCAKKTADRGPFDLLVLEHFEQAIVSKAAEITMAIETKIASAVPLEQESVTLQKELDEATAAHHLAADVLQASLAEQKGALVDHNECKVELMNFEPTLQSAMEALDKKTAALDSFQTWNKASFDVLKARPTPSPKTVALPKSEPMPDVAEEVPCQASA